MGGFPAYNYTSFDLNPSLASNPVSSMWGQPAAPLDASSFNFGANTPSPLASLNLTDPGSLSPMSGSAPMSMDGSIAAPNIAGGGGQPGGGFFGGMTGGQKIGMGISGLQTLGGLWMGLKQMSLAKKQFQFSRDYANTNLANSMKTYNTALADRARARGFTEGDSTGAVNNYVQQNALSKAGGPAANVPVMALPSAQAGNAAPTAAPASDNTPRNPNGY